MWDAKERVRYFVVRVEDWEEEYPTFGPLSAAVLCDYVCDGEM
jgi:hypothetical protein